MYSIHTPRTPSEHPMKIEKRVARIRRILAKRNTVDHNIIIFLGLGLDNHIHYGALWGVTSLKLFGGRKDR